MGYGCESVVAGDPQRAGLHRVSGAGQRLVQIEGEAMKKAQKAMNRAKELSKRRVALSRKPISRGRLEEAEILERKQHTNRYYGRYSWW